MATNIQCFGGNFGWPGKKDVCALSAGHLDVEQMARLCFVTRTQLMTGICGRECINLADW